MAVAGFGADELAFEDRTSYYAFAPSPIGILDNTFNVFNSFN